MKIRTDLHAGADSAKNLNCAAQLDALNQQINRVEYVLSQCPNKPIIVNPPGKDGWWMWGPNVKVQGQPWSYNGWYYPSNPPTTSTAPVTNYGIGGGGTTTATGGGYVGSVYYPDRSGFCG